jgi:hypothetical protein
VTDREFLDLANLIFVRRPTYGKMFPYINGDVKLSDFVESVNLFHSMLRRLKSYPEEFFMDSGIGEVYHLQKLEKIEE